MSRADSTERRVALNAPHRLESRHAQRVEADRMAVPLKPKRVQVSMPRQQRPLYVPEGDGIFSGPFWPQDDADRFAVWALSLVLIAELLLLVYLIWRR